jgi:cell division protein ZapA
MAHPIKVEIYDQVYNVAGDLDETYVQELARHVDARMREIAHATQMVDSLKVAVLAALAIADELHSLRESREESRAELRDQARRCLTLVERALKQSA